MLRETYQRRCQQYYEGCEKEVKRLIKILNQVISEQLPSNCFKKKSLIISFQTSAQEDGGRFLIVEINGERYQYDFCAWTAECFELLDRYMKEVENAKELSYCKVGRTYEILV